MKEADEDEILELLRSIQENTKKLNHNLILQTEISILLSRQPSGDRESMARAHLRLMEP